jgi:methionyl-tRNA formyltransferase
MKLVLITQNEKMFLPKFIDYLLRRLDPSFEVVGAVVSDASPFGSQITLVKKIKKTLHTFGLNFVFRYGLNIMKSKLTGVDVLSILKRNKIQIIKLNESINSSKSLNILSNLDADLYISITGNEIFKKELINIPHHGIINLHTALLPKYRGLMPSFWVLKNNEDQTGVSVFFVDEGIDSGPIIVQKKLRLGGLSQWKLIEMTKFLGIEAIVEALELIRSNKVIVKENSDDESNYFSFPTKKDVKEFRQAGARFF